MSKAFHLRLRNQKIRWIFLLLIFVHSQVVAFDLLSLNKTLAYDKGLGSFHVADFVLGQTWQADASEGFEEGVVSVYLYDNRLYFLATLRDLMIFSDADSMNQKMWRLGDVFEVFIGIPDVETYYELHVTPNNKKLQLRWTPATLELFRKGDLLLQDQLIGDLDFITTETIVNRKENYWQALMSIPVSSIGVAEAGGALVIDVAFCRYDATRGIPSVLSASAPFTARNFHQREAWHKLAIEGIGE